MYTCRQAVYNIVPKARGEPHIVLDVVLSKALGRPANNDQKNI